MKKNNILKKNANQILEARRKKTAMEKLYKILRQKNRNLSEEIAGHIEKERIMEAIIITLVPSGGRVKIRRGDISAALERNIAWRCDEEYIEAVADCDGD